MDDGDEQIEDDRTGAERASTDPPGELAEAARLGRYVVLGTLGQGGMGVVLKAFDLSLDRQVALKVLRKELDQGHTARLLREAQALAKLSHPNVVQVYEAGEVDGQTFVAMELVKGKTLREWMRPEPRPSWKDCVEVFVQLGAGLAAAHEQGLVHRDFKPGNAIIDEKGRPRVLDFGLARQVDREEEDELRTLQPERADAEQAATQQTAAAQDIPMTQTGTVLGTPAYMPPEQMQGREADARSDQFSFCVSLYEALYGERPFEGTSMVALVVSIHGGKVRPAPKGSTVPTKLRTVLLRGLSTQPEQRWPSMDALLAELRRLGTPWALRWLALGLTVGLVAIGGGLAFGQYVEVKDRCTGAAAQLEGIWDEGRAKAVKAALLGTGLSYAPYTWTRVQQGFDDYAGAWVVSHTEVCEATSVRNEQSPEVMDLRMGCLWSRRIALREAVEVLVEADETRVQKAVNVVSSLPGLSRCDDIEALQAELPPPEDPQVAEQVEAQRELLVEAKALTKAGAYDEALVVAEKVVEQAEALAYAPLLAEALLQRGNARDPKAQFTEAERDLERAYTLAAEHGYDGVEATAVANLTFVVGYRQARFEPGLWWAKTALPLAKGPGVGPLAEATAVHNIAIVLYAQHKLPEALTHHQRALAIREQALGPTHLAVASSLNNIGLVLQAQGKLEEALTHFQRALTAWEDALGPTHPRVAIALTSVGTVLRAQGNLPEALTHLQRALAILEDALGPTHPDIASALNNIGGLLREQGKLSEALLYMQRASTLWEQALGPAHPDVAYSLNNIGNVLSDQGKLAEALTHQQRALAIFEDVLGPTHPDVATALNNIGNALSDQGKLAEALTHQQRALAIREEALGPTHPAVAQSLNNIGNVLHEQGKLAEALTHQQRALAVLEEALGPTHHNVIYPLFALTNLALEQHDFDVARTHAERALSVLESSAVSPDELAEARFVLTRALWSDRSQRPRAHQLAQQARDTYAEHGASMENELAEVEQWLKEHPLAVDVE